LSVAIDRLDVFRSYRLVHGWELISRLRPKVSSPSAARLIQLKQKESSV